MYKVNEIFATIQGEAKFTGTPSVFVRMQFCDVGCSWCDTKHTWDLEGNEILVTDMLDKKIDSSDYTELSAKDLTELLCAYKIDHIVITGGEPCAYDLNPLTDALIAAGKSVQIETSGTYPIMCHENVWVTVSPKIGMNRKVLPSSLHRANEIKHPVGKQKDIQNLRDLELKDKVIWLQPLSASKKATNLCIETAIENNWNVSIQTHKFVGIR